MDGHNLDYCVRINTENSLLDGKIYKRFKRTIAVMDKDRFPYGPSSSIPKGRWRYATKMEAEAFKAGFIKNISDLGNKIIEVW